MKHFMMVTLTFILGAVAYFWFYNSVKLIPRAILFGNPDKVDVQLSADGKHLSFISSLDGVLNIFVGTTEKPTEALAVTAQTGRGISGHFWLYDHHSVAYLKDDGGDENSRIHIVDVVTKEDRVVTPAGAKALIYALSENFPDEMIIGLNKRDPSYHDVYRLNVKTGELILLLKNDQHFSDFILDNTFSLRFASRSTADAGIEYFRRIWNQDSNNFEWETYLKVPYQDLYTTSLLGLTKDGKILYVLDSIGRDLNVLKSINLSTNEEIILAQGNKAEISGIISDPIKNEVQAYVVNYLRKECFCVNEEFQSHYEHLRSLLKGELVISSRTLDDSSWIVAEVSDRVPAAYYLYQPSSRKLSFLFYQRADLKKYDLAPMLPVEIIARDGLHLPSYLTRPINSKGLTPLVLIVHGGPWARDVWGYNSQAQWLANRGYTVLQVNFRASRGFGKLFTNMGNLEWGRKMHEDLLDAVTWAIQEGFADPQKIAIYGGSYGGYAALWAATQSGDVFKCAVDVVGPSNLKTLIETIPPYWDAFLEAMYKSVGDIRTQDGSKLLVERSPLTHVDQIKIPVLIAQGEKDPRVKQSESEQIVQAMKNKNLPYSYMLFMDEGHGFVRPENRIAFYGAMENFLSQHLDGAHEPLTEAQINQSTLLEAHKKELLKTLGIAIN